MNLAHHTSETPAVSFALYPDFHRAYVDQLRLVFDDPTYNNAPRGFKSRERLAAQFRLSDPRQRVPFIPSRRVNIVFNFAEALWYLTGRDDLEFIGYYASTMRRYSMDSQRLTGTAYGKKLFGGPPHQYDTLIEVLKSDPDSKRAVVQIFDMNELRVPNNIDVSCTLGLQFLLREGRLHSIAYMRANDAFRGMVSDLFSFTLIQEFLACELGVELGTYTHVAGSLHVYEPDDERTAAVLADPAATEPPLHRLPPMPQGDNRPAVVALMEIEEQLRHNRLRLPTNVDRLDLPPYWAQVALLFETYRRVRQHEPLTTDLVAALDPAYRTLVAHRWASRMEARR
ncbi:MAG: thymidylate synthase [Nannocystis sp.]|nr:thymidylate synthase [Nannocystis sp.]